MKSFLIRKTLSLKIRLFNLFHRKSPKIALLSSEKWRGKILDDLLVAREFNRSGYRSEIISWDNLPKNLNSFSAFLVTSMWGYEDDEKSFAKWLEIFSNQKILNDISVIKNNFEKKSQTNLLKLSGIPIIPTEFIEKNSKSLGKSLENSAKIFATSELVVKPTVSGSGKNTYLFGNSPRNHSLPLDFENLPRELTELNKKKSLLVQPFLKEIDEGELAVIMINGKISHAVRRFPHIFSDTGSLSVVKISSLDEEVKKICEKVASIPEYKDALYSRIDFVKKDGKYLVMEVEFFEPNLYFSIQPNREKLLKTFVSAFLEKIC